MLNQTYSIIMYEYILLHYIAYHRLSKMRAYSFSFTHKFTERSYMICTSFNHVTVLHEYSENMRVLLETG